MPLPFRLVSRGGVGWLGAPTPPVPGNQPVEPQPDAAPGTPPDGDSSTRSNKPSPQRIPDDLAYNALHSHTGLFVSFVESATSRQEMEHFFRAFAEREWGRRSAWPPSIGHDPCVVGGSGMGVDDWLTEAQEMKRVVDLWGMLRGHDHARLHNYIKWRRSGEKVEVIYDHREWVKSKQMRGRQGDRQEVIASADKCPEWLAFFEPGDVVLPAVAFLQAKINERLAGKVTLRLLYDGNEKRLCLRPMPDSLLTALWLQFAWAVDGDKNYRKCNECGAWFELSPEVARTNRRFCSNACRSRMYRQRQARAREMCESGMTPETIAEQLDTEVETVRGWLGTGEEPSPGK